MISFDFSKHCCGCAACVDACPQKCICIVEDEKDFRIPNINVNECINCGLCEKVCPVINSDASRGLEKLFCGYNNNALQRKAGSSGSLFILLAKKVIENGGVVVGAAFDDNLQLRHRLAYDDDGIMPLMKSKYIQSNTTGIFNKVRAELKDGKQCLFVGTPCQCQALYNFMGRKQIDNLLLVDFICHGVPSQKLFDKAIQSFEKRRDCKVESFNFREKAKGELHCYSISYVYNDGERETDIGTSREFPFYNGYLSYRIFRESCYECKFAQRERVSDITLGDFWNLGKIKGIKDFRKGYSMIIVNSNKGLEVIQNLSDKISIEEFPIEIAEKNNYAYTHPTEKRLLHKWFLRDYNKKPYDEVEKLYLQAPVGIRQEFKAFINNIINSLIVLK